MTNSILKQTIQVENSSHEKVTCDIRNLRTNVINEDNVRKYPVVLICPGFMAFKDWGPFPYYGDKLAKAGFVSIVLNYSHNGITNDYNRITELEKLANNTVSKELEDIKAVIDEIANDKLKRFNIDTNKILLLGHSRGAANALITAANDSRIKALVTWAGIAKYDRWTKNQKDNWKKIGYLPLGKNITSNPLKINLRALEDLELHKNEYNLLKAARSVQIPWLIIHGEEDLIVKIEESINLYEASNKTITQFVKLKTVGHLFGTTVPFDENNSTINHLLELTINWLKYNCK